MNNIYVIELKEHDYDEYDSFVVIAKNKKEAQEICDIQEKPERWRENLVFSNVKSITIIGTTNKESGMVLGSYNAG